MYQQQMLCVIAPCEDATPDVTLLAAHKDLDAALTMLGYVHFASLALLPPPSVGEPPFLMLELAVDDGIDPVRAVGDLIDVAADLLGRLYLPAHGAPSRVVSMPEALRSLLLPLVGHARPAGGFVGMRDRTVAQIRAEQRFFHVARAHMIRIRDQARMRPTPPTPAALVDELQTSLANDPAHVAMQSPAPRSFWCKPRSPLSQLLMALVWAVLPVPAMLCAIATIGLLADLATPAVLPVDSGLFGLGLAASAGFLLALLLIWLLMRKGGISMLVFFVLASAVGVLTFYVVLVTGYAMVADAKPPAAWLLPLSAPRFDGLAIGVLLLLWGVTPLISNAAMQVVMVATAIVGAGVAILMLATASLGTTQWPAWISWNALSYYLPALLAAWLIRSSVIARWVFSMGLALMLVLLPMLQHAWTWIPRERVNDLLKVGLFKSEMIYFLLGLLALVGVPLLVAVAGTLLGLLVLRSPRAPLGLPLLLGLAALVLLVLLLGWSGDWLFHQLHPSRALESLHTPTAIVCAACLLVIAGLFFWTLRAFATGLIPAIMRYEAALDRPPANGGGNLRPCELHRTLVDNDASLAGCPSHMISVTDVRGWRAWMWRPAWLFLHVVGLIGHAWFTKGLLATASGIKFAHWHLIDNGRRLLFVSNFDGDFSGYLDQFILGASEGINLVWRWTRLDARPPALPGQPGVPFERRFPPTRRLSFLGCRYEQRFKAYAHASMVPHLYLYQAYRYSNDDIQRASLLRDSLLGERTTEKDDLVLRILES